MLRLSQALLLLPFALANGCADDHDDQALIDGATMAGDGPQIDEDWTWTDSSITDNGTQVTDHKVPDRSMPARLRRAERLAALGHHDLATKEFVWLWQNMLEHQPSQYGVRRSFMALSMKDLAAKSAKARESFCGLRDRLTDTVRGPGVDFDALSDWITLNEIVGEESRTLRWFNECKAKPGAKRLLPFVARDIALLLRNAGRWVDLRHLYPEPIEALEFARLQRELMSKPPRNVLRRMTEGQKARVAAVAQRRFQSTAATLYAAMLAASRPEAKRIAKSAKGADASAAMVIALIDTALDADQPRPAHRQWLDAVRERTKDVRTLRALFALRVRLNKKLNNEKRAKEKRDG